MIPDDVVPPSRRLKILLVAMIGTFVVTRASLMFRPNADFDIAGYNVHHMFTGFLIAAACAIPLALVPARRRVTEALVAGLGVGLALGLDEVVYLIVTDGSNASYLTRPSWIGGIVFVALAALYSTLLVWRRRRAAEQRTR